MIRTARVAAIAAVVSLGACTAPTGPTEGRVEIGTWGGEHLRLEVTQAGATTEFDCAHGTIDEPLVADRNGRFSAAGTHTFDHGGPIRNDEVPNRHPARYEGQAIGDTLQLTITVTDTSQVLGSFILMRGSVSRLLKCL